MKKQKESETEASVTIKVKLKDGFSCIVCGAKIEEIEMTDTPIENPSEGCWNNGIVERTYAGYGSSLDGNIYDIGICDACLERKEKEGVIKYQGNAFGFDK